MSNTKPEMAETVRSKVQNSIGRRMIILSVCCILITAIVTGAVIYFSSQRSQRTIFEEDTQNGISALTNETSTLAGSAAKEAVQLAANESVRALFAPRSTADAAAALKDAVSAEQSDVDFAVLADTNGTVIASTNENVKAGTSLAGLDDVKQALGGGEVKGFLETGDDIALAVRASAPVKNAGGQTAAVLCTGYDMSNNERLDKLKESFGCDFTFFLSDVRLSTTVQNNGKRATGTKANADITAKVIEKQQSYTGETKILNQPYSVRYSPMTDAGGKVVGMYFAGKPLAAVRAVQHKFMLLAALIALLLAAVSITIFVRFAKYSIAEPLENMSEAASKLSEGSLSVEIPDFSTEDEIGQLTVSLRAMMQQLRLYVGDITAQLERMAKGDMTSDFDVSYVGDFAPILSALQKISDSLNDMLAEINLASGQVSMSAQQVADSSQTLAEGASNQAASVEELSAEVENVARSVQENAESVHDMSDALAQAVGDADGSSRQAEEMLTAMTGIQESADKIEAIIKSIDNIAFQTNILALNAAVEAARAGTAGKGFAVVADEVRNLAAKSAEASQQTAVLISDTRDRVHVGYELAEKTAGSSHQISTKIRRVMENMDTISQSSAAQAAAVAQINERLATVSAVVQTNNATSEECAAASEELSTQANLLRQQVSRFQLRGAEASGDAD